MSVRQGGKVIAGNVSHYNIGDTFLTKRTDTNLAGAVECDGATYNTTDFTGSGSIGELLEAGKLDYVSLSAYSTAISTKGWCDKIGWDGTGTTSFRVPTLTPHIVQTNNIPVVGNEDIGIITPDTPSTIGKITVVAGYGLKASGISASVDEAIGITTDGTKSGIIADTSDTAQLRVMIQIANGATDEALETCTGVLADVATLKGYDYVVESQLPTAQNNYTWYRKYKSGWVEQGGITNAISVAGNSGTNVDVTLPITMADTNYNVLTTRKDGDFGFAQTEENTNIVSTSVIRITLWNNISGTASGGKFWWQVSGMAAN